MNEDLHTAEWLRTTLMGDTGPGGLADPAANYDTPPLRISGAFHGKIPPDHLLPAVRFFLQDANDIREVGSARIMVRLDWLVLLVNDDLSIAPILPLVDRIDTLLNGPGQIPQGVSGSTSTLTVYSCVRLQPFSIIEDDSGVSYRHVGGIYRTMVQSK